MAEFEEFAATEHSQENIIFWKAVRTFKENCEAASATSELSDELKFEAASIIVHAFPSPAQSPTARDHCDGTTTEAPAPLRAGHTSMEASEDEGQPSERNGQ